MFEQKKKVHRNKMYENIIILRVKCFEHEAEMKFTCQCNLLEMGVTNDDLRSRKVNIRLSEELVVQTDGSIEDGFPSTTKYYNIFDGYYYIAYCQRFLFFYSILCFHYIFRG